MIRAGVPRRLLAALLVALISTPWKVDAQVTYLTRLKSGRTARCYAIKTKAAGQAGIQLVGSNKLVLTVDIKRLNDFRSVEIRDARHQANIDVNFIIYSAGDGGGLDNRSGQLLIWADINQSLVDLPLLESGDAWLAVTTKKHKVGELVGRLEPLRQLDPVLGDKSLPWTDIIALTNLVNSFFQVATMMGLPAISPGNILPTAALQMTSTTFDALTGPMVTDRSLKSRLYRDSAWALAAYDEAWISAADPVAHIAKVLDLPMADIVDVQVYADHVIGLLKVPYYVAIDRPNRRFVVGIRGSVSISDWSTDFMGSTRVIDATQGVGAHDGIYASTNILLGQIAGPLASALDANPVFGLVFIGHSLGAGVATMAAYLVRNSISREASEVAALPGVKDSATAIGYCTPPVLTMDAAASTMPYVTSLVMGNDMVPRAGYESLLDELLAVSESGLARLPSAKIELVALGLNIVNVKFLIDAINGRGQPPRKLLGSPFSPLEYDYAATSVDSSLINGAQAVYPMYAPGNLYQMPTFIDLLSADRIKCSKTLVAAADATERFKSMYFKLDMIHSHLLPNVINCLAQL
eukprot:gene20069-26784_t